jgi:hypothetical protein
MTITLDDAHGMIERARAHAAGIDVPMNIAVTDHLRTRPYTPRTNGKVCVLGSSGRPAGRRGSPLLPV